MLKHSSLANRSGGNSRPCAIFTRMTPKVHHHWLDLPTPADSYVLLSDSATVNAAVFFVHGFGGSSQGTWRHFQTLIDALQDAYPWWKESDLYFLKYESVFDRTAVSADALSRFVSSYFPTAFDGTLQEASGSAVRTTLARSEIGPRYYRDLILVGHSEGAMLIRQLALTLVRIREQNLTQSKASHVSADAGSGIAYEKKVSLREADPGVFDATVCLFAPATFGASVAGLPGLALRMAFFGRIVEAVLGALPAYRDLHSVPLLQTLREDTVAMAERYPSCSLLRAHVLWGKSDSFVTPGEYRTDYLAEFVNGESHLSICKPTRNYLKPIEWVTRYA